MRLRSKGWAVPAATLNAFALGVFSLFGVCNLPNHPALFLLSVAIFEMTLARHYHYALFLNSVENVKLLSLSVAVLA